ncbi:MAG TPA: alpha/beta fold hydrolase [Bryobacteraceae bacterium]|nr:alpha/beta fold hydrolase [Bryobacteraceae bacterium]
MATRRWVFLTGTIAGAALLVLTAASAVFCEGTLRVQKTASGSGVPPKDRYPDALWRTVHIRAKDGVALDGWFIRPNKSTSSRCVVVLHGIADSKSGAAGFAPMFLAEGYSVLLPDSRAHGNSGGEFVTYGLFEKSDVLEWTRWLRKEGCSEICGLGESLGASVLIQASAEEPVFRAIVAECPYADLKAIAVYRVQKVIRGPQWISSAAAGLIVHSGMLYAKLRYGLDFSQVAPTMAIARSKTPILLIHGVQDGRTPCWHSQRLAQANPRAILWLVPNADHVGASSADPDGFRSRVLDWFARS